MEAGEGFGEGSGREGTSTSDFGRALVGAASARSAGGGSRMVAGALLDTGGVIGATASSASSDSALPHDPHDDVPSIAYVSHRAQTIPISRSIEAAELTKKRASPEDVEPP